MEFNDIFNLTLNNLQEVIPMRGRQLSKYGLPQLQTVDNDRFVREYCQEINYDQTEQQAYVHCNTALFTADQHKSMNVIVPRLIGMKEVLVHKGH